MTGYTHPISMALAGVNRDLQDPERAKVHVTEEFNRALQTLCDYKGGVGSLQQDIIAVRDLTVIKITLSKHPLNPQLRLKHLIILNINLIPNL